MRSIVTTRRPLEALDVEILGVTVRPGTGLSGAAAEADGWLGGALRRCLEDGTFAAAADDVEFLAPGDRDRPSVVAVGVGDGEVDAERIRRAAGSVAREARRRGVDGFGLAVPRGDATDDETAVQAAAEGATLGDWSFDGLREKGKGWRANPRPGRAVLRVAGSQGDVDAAADRGRTTAEAQNWARDLAFQPANVVTPAHLAERARELAEGRDDLHVEAWGPDRLRREGFGALLAVARGSDEPPRFITLDHRPVGAGPGRGAAGESEGAGPAESAPDAAGGDELPTYVVAGKGVTFDAGGISLKSSGGMEDMKYDMAGAAAVLGVLRAVSDLALPARVVGLVPATENLPSGRALKPGDVIRGVSGTSIEIISTDAEGRLILSDTLSHAARYEPDAVVDLATLTGGCIVALGHHASGLFTDDDGLADGLAAIGDRTGERLWRLPLWDVYRKQLDSDIADIKNSGGKGASSVTAAWFLKSFVGDYRWAHLDIAGTAWADEPSPCQPEGATGVGVRLLTEWLRSEAAGEG